MVSRSPAVAMESRPYGSPASDFHSRRENDLSEVTQFHARYVNGTLLGLCGYTRTQGYGYDSTGRVKYEYTCKLIIRHHITCQLTILTFLI